MPTNEEDQERLESKGSKKILPERMQAYEDGSHQSVTDLITEVYMLDLTIDQWAEQLHRAQPLFPGKLLINFGKTNFAGKTKLDGDLIIQTMPYPARMFKMTSGKWFLKKLSRNNKGEWVDGHFSSSKLEHFRVGQYLRDSDRVVLRLIRGIEKFIEKRGELIAHITQIRAQSAASIKGAKAMRASSHDDLDALEKRIKMDWKNDVNGCYEALRQQSSARRKTT